MKAAVLTLGCKVNQAESGMIEDSLRSQGWDIVGLGEDPALCIINTCSVTAKSDYQSRQLIRRANRCGARIIVTGCYSELHRGAVSSMDGVAAVVDNMEKVDVIGNLTRNKSDGDACLSKTGRSRAFLKLQDGCNLSCSYCVIPRARGRSRSIGVDDALRGVKLLSSHHSEVVLTGIHLGTYGYDLSPKVTLSYLLNKILTETTVERIRLSSLEVQEIDDALIELMKDSRVCKHLHVPLQSGDDTTLKLMNRRYTAAEYERGIEGLMAAFPQMALGTDVIAGFPGESDARFEKTQCFLDSLPFSYLHVFPFSPRPGTKASEMGSQVALATKKERCTLLRALGEKKKNGYMTRQIEQTLDLLIEEVDEGGMARGTTGNYLRVEAPLDVEVPRNIVPVTIAAMKGNNLVGYPIRAL